MSEQDGKAQSRATIRRKRLKDYSRENLLDYLKDLAARLNKSTITRRDLKDDGEVSEAPFHKQFGGLPQALIEVGLKPSKVPNPGMNDILPQLARLMRQLGCELLQNEINASLPYKAHQFKTAFGTLEKAFDAAENLLAQETGTESDLPGRSRICYRQRGSHVDTGVILTFED